MLYQLWDLIRNLKWKLLRELPADVEVGRAKYLHFKLLKTLT